MATADAALIRRAQQKLKDLSLYSGAVDGVSNAAYVSALQRYQRDHHLTVNGQLDSATRSALGVS